MSTLRDYQQKASDGTFTAWEESPTTLLVMPTGCGKTQVFTDVIRRVAPKRAMVLAHREELIWQARNRIEQMTGLTVEVEMADLRATDSFLQRPDVVVTTVQTQCAGRDGLGRMTRFRPNDFGLLVIDEAHHATADSYRKVIDYYRQNPDLKVLGVTATPDRADEEALGKVFGNVAFDYEILDAIHEGWLVPIDQQMVNVANLDFSEVKTTAGDLNGADLAAIMEAEGPIQSVIMATVEAMFKLPPNTLEKIPVAQWWEACQAFGLDVPRRTLAFASSVRHAEMMSEILNRVHPGLANWICGATPKDERREKLKLFDEGKTAAMINCAVLTEGYDSPGVQVIVMARPTKSRSLYSQMVGRSTRPLPGLVDPLPTAEERKAAIAASLKPSCLVIDFVGNSGRHKLMSSADILGGNVSDAAIERALKKAKEDGKPVRMDALLDKSEQEIRDEIEERRRLEEARKARLVGKARYTSHSVNPFDVLQLQPVRERGWDTGKKLSEKQRALLNKQGIDPDSMPYAQAKAILNELFRRWNGQLCTFKQAKLLGKWGFDPKNVTMTQATDIINKVAANNWRPPSDTERNAFLERRQAIAKPKEETVPF